MTVFDLANVAYRYPGAADLALRPVDLSIKAGQFWALCGPNGSGKSTLLRCLTAQLTPVSGTVSFAGKPLVSWSAQARAQQLAVVRQNNQAKPALTVREVVALGRTPYRHFWQAITLADREAVDAALRQCDLVALADRPFLALSGGQQQRVWLALALAQTPSVIILDEPTTFLDIHYQLDLLKRLKALTQRGVTVIAVLHDLNQVLQFADTVALLAAGTLMATGTPEEVLNAKRVGQLFQVEANRVQDPAGQSALIFH
ncbi:ABC transporter ATP-binding protein [Lacticaseibacillus mingshuiensis]|uniref:ABC transporter ATP-binding protein n=1 Tax=Lacticaseibacillus mingshuiensis TaxID=2799574 RepID=A0ABW4CME9_9LACO|nr:ABC transporter ATP-binding protein [Lacticaseibacillus mingshuiensis]